VAAAKGSGKEAGGDDMSEQLNGILERSQRRGFYDGFEGKPEPPEPHEDAQWVEKMYYEGYQAGARERVRRQRKEHG
jgi:ribosome modulation factor